MTVPPPESEAHAQANAQQVRLLHEALAQRRERGHEPATTDRRSSAQPVPPHPQPRR